jgi:hypothetical protein
MRKGENKPSECVSTGATRELVMGQTSTERQREKIKGINTDNEKQINTRGNEVEKSAPLVTANPVGTPHHKLNRIVHCPEHAFDGASVAPTLLVSENHGLARL